MHYRLMSGDGDRFGDLTLYRLSELAREGKISLNDTVCGLGAGRAPTTVEVLLCGVKSVSPGRFVPPALSWISTMVAGALSGGYLLNVSALRLGIWSCRVMPKSSAILVPAIGLVLPPAHLIYALFLIWSGEKHHVFYGLLHLVIGFFAIEAITVLCAAISSLIIRRTLLTALGPKTGIRINIWLTLLLNMTYLTFKTNEIRAMYGLPNH